MLHSAQKAAVDKEELRLPHAHRMTSRRPVFVTGLVRNVGLISFLICLLSSVPACAHGSVTVNVLSLMSATRMAPGSSRAIVAGFNASMARRREIISKDVKVHLTESPNINIPMVQRLEDFLKQHKDSLVVVLGPTGGRNTQKCLPLLEREKVVAFSPLSASGEIRQWTKHTYFLTAEPAAEVAALIRYAVVHLRVKRLGFMYLKGVSIGEMEYLAATDVMNFIGYQISGLFWLPSKKSVVVSDAEFEEKWKSFAASQPQAVIVFGPIRDRTQMFLNKLVSDPLTSNAYLLTTSSAEFTVANAWHEALDSAGANFVPGRVITIGNTPFAANRDILAMRRFRDEMHEYLSSSDGTGIVADPDQLLQDVNVQPMVYGWLAGEVLSRALQIQEWTKSREAFMESLYDQRRYVIDDLVFGDFGGECGAIAQRQGAVCRCNQGGNTVYMRLLIENKRFVPLNNGQFMFNNDECSIKLHEMRAPLVGLLFSIEDNSIARRATKLFTEALLSFDAASRLKLINRLFFTSVPSSTSGVAKQLQLEHETSVYTGIFGVVSDEMLAVPGVVFIDPLTMVPRLNRGQRNVIHLSPTVEQQFFVLSMYLETIGGRLHAVLRTNEGDEMLEILEKSLVSFGMSLTSATVLGVDTPLSGRLPSSGHVFLVGLFATDIVTVARHLEEHSELRVVVLFSEWALLYDEFVKAFEGSPAASRLVFATSLPHWDEERLKSRTADRYRESLGASAQKAPLPLLGFYAALFVRTLLSQVTVVDDEALFHVIYYQSPFNIKNMKYGPFSEDKCLGHDDTHSADCRVNYGASNIAVWSMARALNVSVAPLAGPVSPSMLYVDPNAGMLTRRQIIGIAVGACVAALLILFVAYLLYFSLRSARNNANAPKELTAPVSLVFTDIESSTALWAARGELMPDAVAAHHRLIRALIVRHDCYEVKTVGDSFMIACKSAFAAAQLVRDLQQHFLTHNWGTKAIDESYREFEKQKAVEDEDYVPQTTGLEPSVYKHMWSGLRVRAGVHTGLCDIRHDEVTKGYDYYGGTANLAARTESVAHGGQVLLTHAAYMALSTSEREQLDVTPLGPVPLRGVPKPVKMYQLNAVPGRTFNALRLDRDFSPCEFDESWTDNSENGSSLPELCDHASMVFKSLNVLLSTFTLPQQQKVIRSFCERWRVRMSHKTKSWNSEQRDDMLKRIAVKVSRVVTRSSKDRDDAPALTFGYSSMYSGVTSAGRRVSLSQLSTDRALSDRPRATPTALAGPVVDQENNPAVSFSSTTL
uniref:adenylate cyclase n=1 Tax=Trypanosoma vivax (strain Y486) TaxID=1055687 RepID=G0TZT5_TRYVY|nr:putative receptor-type adenylate cyclase [Trypanosoma vivax Y486]